MRLLNKSSAKLYAGIVVAGLIATGCTSADPEKQKPIQRQSELLRLPVAAGEDAISSEVVPVDIQAPCLPPIMGGLRRYADVGWVSPRFFLVAGNGGPGYTFQPLLRAAPAFAPYSGRRGQRARQTRCGMSAGSVGSGSRTATSAAPLSICQTRASGVWLRGPCHS